MNVKAKILEPRSREQVASIVNWVGTDPKKYDKVMKLLLANEPVISQRISMVVDHIFDQTPTLVLPYLDQLIKLLQNNTHNAIPRTILRVLSFIDVPEKHHSILLNICFDLLLKNDTPIAIKVHAMQTLYNLSIVYPEIRTELAETIKIQLPMGSAGFKNRGNKILNLLG